MSLLTSARRTVLVLKSYFRVLCFSDLEGFLNEFADIGKEDSPSIEELFSVCCVSVI